MKFLATIAVLLIGISAVSATKKCESYLPNSNPKGVEVTGTKVVFPATTKDPSAQSKISTKFDSKGLSAFFKLARSFMNTVQNKELPPLKGADGKMRKIDTIIKDVTARKGDFYEFEVPIVACCCVGIALALLMPLIGFCFCCCRCCGNCGGDMTQKDGESQSHFKCCIFSFILFILFVFMLTGVLMMFVTNNNLKAQFKETPTKYENALDEAWGFLATVRKELKEITQNKTECLYNDLILPDIEDNGVKELIGVKLKAILSPHLQGPLQTVKSSSSNVTDLNGALGIVSNTSSELKTETKSLGDRLDSIRVELQGIQKECNDTGYPKCDQISGAGLEQNANFSNLPNIDSELKSIQDIVGLNFSGAADKAMKVFNDIPQITVDKASPSLKDVRKLAKDGKDMIQNKSADLYVKLDDVIKLKSNFTKYKTDFIDKYIGYDKYRFYGYVGLSGMMLLIVVLLGLGLTCGVGGYKRDRTPTNRTGSSHHAGNCLMAATGFMFLFSFIFFLITAIFFFLGEHLHIICKEIEDGKLFDKNFDFQFNGTTIKVSETIMNCRKGMPVYQAIDAKRIYNLDDQLNFTKLVNIDATLDKINISLVDQSILTENVNKSLTDLTKSNVGSISFGSFFDELKKSLVKVSLTEMANNLTNLANEMKSLNSSKAKGVAAKLDYVAANLTEIQNGNIVNITAKSNQLKKDVQNLQNKAVGLPAMAQAVLNEITKADTYLKTGANGDIKTLVKDYAKRVIGWPDQFVAHTLSELNKNIGDCKPFANVYDGLVNTFLCKGVMYNFNGFWFAMGWCLLFFPFAIIFGVKLAKFLRRMKNKEGFDPYPGYEMEQPAKIPLHEYSGQGHAPPPYVG